MKIKAYTSYDYRNNRPLYRNFEIIDKLPSVEEKIIDNGLQTETVKSIDKLFMDCAQPRDICYNYDYYHMVTEMKEIWDEDDIDIYENDYYYAIEIKEN